MTTILISKDYGISLRAPEGFEKYDAEVKESINAFTCKISNSFNNIKYTDNDISWNKLNDLIAEIKEGHYTHYLTSEGLSPDSFKKLKEANIHVLKVDDQNRTVLENGEKLSLFGTSSKIVEITQFEAPTVQLAGEISQETVSIIRFSRHPRTNEQLAKLNEHYPNAKILDDVKENQNSVDEILEKLKQIKGPCVVDVVLPVNMVLELTEKKSNEVTVIRAQLQRQNDGNFKLEYYQRIDEVVFRTKIFE